MNNFFEVETLKLGDQIDRENGRSQDGLPSAHLSGWVDEMPCVRASGAAGLLEVGVGEGRGGRGG